jgi:metal-responsive CopG/Arc/MetJ family transcriptional regulator
MAEPLDQRIQLVISKGQVREIDEWRRLQPGLPSRSEAIRRLIEAGLKSLEGRVRSLFSNELDRHNRSWAAD